MNIIVGEIRVKRGLKANLPILKEGEPAYCTDTKEYYIGTPEGNVLVGSQTSGGGDTGGGSGSGVLVYNTLAELQTAYPGGTSQPVWVVAENSWYYWEGTVTPPSDTTAPILTITTGGTFTGTKTVTMSVNETADIFYTLDGSTPTTASTKYTAPLSISATTTLKAFARDTAGNVSTVQTVTYTLDTTTPADTTAPNNVTNLQATPSANSVALTWTASASSDVASYDIYNGSTLIANVTGTSYNVTGLTASTSYTFSVRAKDGANNVASGTSVSTTTLAPADTTAPVLTMTAAQTFTDSMTVNMSSNETATIWYTIDDSDPITSGTRLQYTAPITITETDTFKAYAVDTAGNASAVQTVTYTKYSATTLIHDTFTTTAAFDGRTPDTVNNGNKWSLVAGYWTIDSGMGKNGGGVGVTAIDSMKADCTVQAKFAVNTTGTSFPQLNFRVTDNNNRLFVQASATAYELYMRQGSTTNNLLKSSTGITPANGDVVKAVLSGSSIKIYVNDVEVISHTTTVHQTATKHGLGDAGDSTHTTLRWDDFIIIG